MKKKRRRLEPAPKVKPVKRRKQNSGKQSATAAANDWRRLHDKFRALVERQNVRHLMADFQFIGATPSLQSAEILALREGPDSSIKLAFEGLATEAGITLGCPQKVPPVKFWLHSLFVYLRAEAEVVARTRPKNQSPFKSPAEGQDRLLLETPIEVLGDAPNSLKTFVIGASIRDVCTASANFSADLRNRALAAEHRAGRNVPDSFNAGELPESIRREIVETVKAAVDTAGSPKEINAAAATAATKRDPSSEANRNVENSFMHSQDYRSVILRGETYKLTAQQASMIQILHEAHKNGRPDVSIAYILERLEKEAGRWYDTFRSSLKAKKALIKSGERKGTLRLNL